MSTFIIGEAGINHGGSFQRACDLAYIAKACGASAVKYQVWFRNWPDLEYLTFEKDQWRAIFAYCEQIGIPWFATPFDLEAIDFLESCNMQIWKIPSGMITNRPYLEAMRRASERGRLIVSTGMATEDEIENLLQFFMGAQYLYCVSLYPAEPWEIDLRKVTKWYYSGISDHSTGIEIPIAAVALGAQIVEKHLTTDQNLAGPDHKSSLNPSQFADMVKCIRNVEQALRIKPMSPREHAQRLPIRQRMAF